MITKTWTTRSRTDPPNCNRCARLDGQTIGQFENFHISDGSTIYKPPLHPHCDCILTYSNNGVAIPEASRGP